MNIDEMEAGPELDALIAERVMEWNKRHHLIECEDPWYSYCKNCGDGVREIGDEEFMEQECKRPPHYSTNIAAAWEVHVNRRNQIFSKRNAYLEALGEIISRPCELALEAGQLVPLPYALAFLSPLAICRAALKAVEAKK